MPSYIPSRTFAIALIDVLRGTYFNEQLPLSHVNGATDARDRTDGRAWLPAAESASIGRGAGNTRQPWLSSRHPNRRRRPGRVLHHNGRERRS
jgi:hypothetical protein